MGKTADLTVVQKTIIDTLHKEGKPQTFIAKKKLAVHRVLYASMLTETRELAVISASSSHDMNTWTYMLWESLHENCVV